MDKNKIKKAFNDYVSLFSEEDNAIKLKIQHTMNVAHNAEIISNNNDTDLAWLIGILHDIGRFEQLKRYHTFRDEKSVNHAEFGVKLLFDEGLLQNFYPATEEEKDIIYYAILNHNAKEIQPGLNELQQRHCKIIRDADKIDIFRVGAQEDSKTVYGGTKSEIEASILKREIFDIVMQKKTAPYELRESLADDIAVHAAFIWDLSFDISKKLAYEQQYYFDVFSYSYKDAETQKMFDEMESFIRKNVANTVEQLH